MTVPLPRGTTDETGHIYGRLRVIEFAGIDGKAMWHCLCDPELAGCGAQVRVRGDKLRGGRVVSCGCWRADPAIRQAAWLGARERIK